MEIRSGLPIGPGDSTTKKVGAAVLGGAMTYEDGRINGSKEVRLMKEVFKLTLPSASPDKYLKDDGEVPNYIIDRMYGKLVENGYMTKHQGKYELTSSGEKNDAVKFFFKETEDFRKLLDLSDVPDGYLNYDEVKVLKSYSTPNKDGSFTFHPPIKIVSAGFSGNERIAVIDENHIAYRAFKTLAGRSSGITYDYKAVSKMGNVCGADGIPIAEIKYSFKK